MVSEIYIIHISGTLHGAVTWGSKTAFMWHSKEFRAEILTDNAALQSKSIKNVGDMLARS